MLVQSASTGSASALLLTLMASAMRIEILITILIFANTSCMDKKTRILNEIKNAGFPQKEVAVTLETFFEGNNDPASIGVNLYPHQPTPREFYKIFKTIKSSPKTENIFVRISDAEEGAWFYTDAVYIVGDWTAGEIKQIVKELHPDEIYEGWMYGPPVNVPPTSKKVLSLWWD